MTQGVSTHKADWPRLRNRQGAIAAVARLADGPAACENKRTITYDRASTLMAVAMELRRIISSTSETQEQHYLILKEVEGDRSFPIVIGAYEVMCIDRRVRGIQSPRPLTHDLVVTTIESLGGELEDIYISDLRDGTYYARLRIKQDGEMVEIDCRPSDAIAVAVQARVPIFVAEEVINEATDEISPL